MTVQDLIEQLQALPVSARTAQAVVAMRDEDDDELLADITDVRYEHGEVVIDTLDN